MQRYLLLSHPTLFLRQYSSQAHNNLVGELSQELETIKAAGTYKNERVIEGKQGMEIRVKGYPKPLLNFCANNYLGLSTNPEVINVSTLYNLTSCY